MNIDIHDPIDARKQVLQEFKVEQGRIKNPGKFEGEMLYVPYYWEIGCNGLSDYEYSNGDWGFRINKLERRAFPEVGKRRRVIRLHERDDGFVVEV